MASQAKFSIEEAKVNGKSLFRDWMSGLNKKQQATVDARLADVRLGNFGKHRNLAAGILELKFKSGERLYCGKEGDKIIVLLLGGDKSGGKKQQTKDIEFATDIWKAYTKGNS